MRQSLTTGTSVSASSITPEPALSWRVSCNSSPLPCNSTPWAPLPVTTVRSIRALAPASTLSPFFPHPLNRLPTSVARPQLTRTQSRRVSLTDVFLTSTLAPSDRPWSAREMTAPSITVPRPPRTRMPYQEPRSPWEVSSTGRTSVPFTTRVPSTMSSTRRESSPDRSASSEAAMTRTPGWMTSSTPQPTVTSPVST
jgi:hypothetical protein